MNSDVLVIHATETLDKALEKLTSQRLSWAPVVNSGSLEQDCCPVGVMSAVHIMQFSENAHCT